MPMLPEIKDMMAPDILLSKIRQAAIDSGMRTLWQNAVAKVLRGRDFAGRDQESGSALNRAGGVFAR